MSKTLIFLDFISSASSCMLKKWAQDLYCDVLLSLSMIRVVSCFMSISANFSLIATLTNRWLHFFYLWLGKDSVSFATKLH